MMRVCVRQPLGVLVIVNVARGNPRSPGAEFRTLGSGRRQHLGVLLELDGRGGRKDRGFRWFPLVISAAVLSVELEGGRKRSGVQGATHGKVQCSRHELCYRQESGVRMCVCVCMYVCVCV